MAAVVGGNATLKPKTLYSSLAGASESYSKRWRQYYEASRAQGINGLNYFKKLYVTHKEPVRDFAFGHPLRIIIVCWRELLAEFFGTLLLVFMVCGGVVVNNLNDTGPTAAKILSQAMMYGLTMMVLVWATANTSGGHLNPAVTLAVMVMQDISLFKGLLFITMQLCGAMGGAGILYGLVDRTAGLPVNYGATKLGVNVSTQYNGTYTEQIGQGFGIELVITFIFVWVVLSTSRENRKDRAHFGVASPIPIGLAVVVCNIMAGPLTGASLNPARSLGPAIVGGYWYYHYIYWFGPLGGALFAALLYRFLFSLPNPSLVIPRVNPDGSTAGTWSHLKHHPARAANHPSAEREARAEPTT